MGKRISESACKQLYKPPLTSIIVPMDIAYAPPRLPTGYKYPPGCGYSNEQGSEYLINVNHPAVSPLYAEYKKFLSEIYSLSDNARNIFEADMILNVFNAEFARSHYTPSDVDRMQTVAIKNLKDYEKWVNHREAIFGKEKAG